jgi:hypothetical protein
MSATVWGMVALIQIAAERWRRETGESSTKWVERVKSVFVDLANTTGCAYDRKVEWVFALNDRIVLELKSHCALEWKALLDTA